MKVVFFLFGGYPASEFCADVSEHFRNVGKYESAAGKSLKTKTEHSQHGLSLKSRIFMEATL
jgi:hypothetical protein